MSGESVGTMDNATVDNVQDGSSGVGQINDEMGDPDDWPKIATIDEFTLNSYESGPGSRLPLPGEKDVPITVDVYNIPEGLEKPGIMRVFRKHKIEPLEIKCIPSADGTGIIRAFVEVSDLKSALKALEMLDKKPPLNLKVSLAQPKDAYARKQEIIQQTTIKMARRVFLGPMADEPDTQNEEDQAQHGKTEDLMSQEPQINCESSSIVHTPKPIGLRKIMERIRATSNESSVVDD